MPEQTELKKYLRENLVTDFTRKSKYPCSSPVLFTKKKYRTLRLCADYPRLNSFTHKGCYPLPRIDDLLQRAGCGRIFSKIDLRGAYNLIRIHPGDEWNQHSVRHSDCTNIELCHSLTNAPAIFQRLMDKIMVDSNGQYTETYIDNIIIYSENQYEHELHVRSVFQRLYDNDGLYAKAGKCEIGLSEIQEPENGSGSDPFDCSLASSAFGKASAVSPWIR
jgi:hypothetical protein